MAPPFRLPRPAELLIGGVGLGAGGPGSPAGHLAVLADAARRGGWLGDTVAVRCAGAGSSASRRMQALEHG